jgi:predicted GNAT family acetyltransferase
VRAGERDPLTGDLRHDTERRRYVLDLDGEVIGFTEYRTAGDGVTIFPHTVTRVEWRDRGVAAHVVRFALDDVREQGKRVVPTCWFVAGFIRDHPEYTDLLAP